jgi:hypothetical protein
VQNLARTIGIMKKDQLYAALSFFDRVGELTYIREHELSEWVFTEPQLLLNAMKSLLVPARNLKKFLQRKQQRELADYGFLENEALKAIWNQYKNQEQLRHLMRAMGLIIEFPDGVAIPCRLPKKPTLWEDKPMEKEIVVTTKYSTRLPPSLYGHALAGLLRHHGTPGQGLRLLSQTTSCIEIDSSKCFLQNEQAQHTITLRAILLNEQAQHAIALRVRAYPASSHMQPDETVLVDTLVRTVKVLVSTLHSLERDRFEWMMLQSCVQLHCSCVQLHCCDNPLEFTILESKRTSESYLANCQDSFLCPAKIRHSLFEAVKQTKHQKTTQAKKYTIFLGHTGQDSTASNFAAFLSHECKREQLSCFYDAGSIRPGIFYDECIQDAVKTCEVFIPILSPTYFKRYWCMHELDLAMQAGRCIMPVFYGIEGEKDLPSEKSAFLEHFSSEDQVDHDELNRWWTNVADMLPRIQGIRRSDFAVKDADIKVIQNIMTNVRRLASDND